MQKITLKFPVARRCMQCGADLGPASWTSTRPGVITDGYCPTCLAVVMALVEG